MKVPSPASSFRRCPTQRLPFVFSYDISSPASARRVRRCLRRWRMDGQLSVHETILTPLEAAALSAELVELVDPRTDSLIVFRLSRLGEGPVYTVTSREPGVPIARPRFAPPPYLHSGWYILAYDVTDPQRLRRLQRSTSRHAIFLQRSVYLFGGPGQDLLGLVRGAKSILREREDDLRIYALSGVHDLRFLCGATPPLDGLLHAAGIRQPWIE